MGYNDISKEEKDLCISWMSDNLYRLRTKAGLTSGDLANLVGISRQTISAIETNKQELSWNNLLSLFLLFSYQSETAQEMAADNPVSEVLLSNFNR